MASYFWRPKPVGLNEDIRQHREHEQRLEATIRELESIKDPNPMQVNSLRAYRHFLAQLLQSKAETVNKLGRKK